MVQNETIGHKHATALIIMFTLGSSLIMGGASIAGKDGWISILLAIAASIPLVMIYARILSLHRGNCIFEITEILFGTVAGTVMNVILVVYSLFLGSLVIRNFSDFVTVSMLQRTPQVIVILLYLIVVAYLVKSGIKTMGKWGIITFGIILFIVFLTIIISFHDMVFFHFLPVADKPIMDIITAAVDQFTYPYAENILFLSAFGALKKEDSPYKTYLRGVLIGGGILLVAFLRNAAILGDPTLLNSYYPSFVTTRISGVQDISERIESLVIINLFFTGIVKVSICMFTMAKGLAHIFRIYDYKKLVMPCAMMLFGMSPIVSPTPMDVFSSMTKYKYYAIPVQIVIPLLIWITAEIKTRKQKGGDGSEKKERRQKVVAN